MTYQGTILQILISEINIWIALVFFENTVFFSCFMFWGPVYFGPSLTFIMIRQRSPFLVNLYLNWNLIQNKLLHAAGFKSVKLTKKCKLLVFDWFLANVPLFLLKVHVKVTSRLMCLMVPMVCHSTDIMYVFISVLQKIVEMIWKEWEI